jgi:hypothetical protein
VIFSPRQLPREGNFGQVNFPVRLISAPRILSSTEVDCHHHQGDRMIL